MRRFDGVIFDMDGTLVEPLLDFQAIRRELHIPSDAGILEALDEMPSADRRGASDRLLAHELGAARRAELMDGARELLDAIAAAGLRTALLTRNAREAMEIILSRFELSFDLAWSRENGPIKPGPVGVRRACEQLGLEPGRTACVGDFHYDITAANDAGAVSVLLAIGPPPEWADQADYVITRLDELKGILGLD